MTRSEFFKEADNQIRPVYLFYGEEDYIKTKACEKLMQTVLEGEPIDGVNLIRLDGKECTADDICAQCITPSFSGSRKLVVVENYAPLMQGAKGKDDSTDQLLEYCHAPEEDTVLLFIANGEVDKKGKLYKALQKQTIVDFNVMTQQELVAWIKRELKNNHKAISEANIAFIIEYCDTHLEALSRELQKLVSYSNGNEVTQEDIKAVLTPSRDYNLFKLSNHIFEKKTDLALELCALLQANKEEPVFILNMVSRQYRLALFFKELLQAKRTRHEIEQLLDIRPFVADILQKYAAVYSEAQLKQGVDYLLEADEGIKTGLIRPEIGLTTTVIKLCRI